jgi:hypothetical protein
MNQIKTMCYDMLLEIIDVAEKKNDFKRPNGGVTGTSLSERREEEDEDDDDNRS